MFRQRSSFIALDHFAVLIAVETETGIECPFEFRDSDFGFSFIISRHDEPTAPCTVVH
jgi:hypothetical protein